MKRGAFILFTDVFYGKVIFRIMRRFEVYDMPSCPLFILLCFLSCCLIM